MMIYDCISSTRYGALSDEPAMQQLNSLMDLALIVPPSWADHLMKKHQSKETAHMHPKNKLERNLY